jgi:hypothetical protein
MAYIIQSIKREIVEIESAVTINADSMSEAMEKMRGEVKR